MYLRAKLLQSDSMRLVLVESLEVLLLLAEPSAWGSGGKWMWVSMVTGPLNVTIGGTLEGPCMPGVLLRHRYGIL